MRNTGAINDVLWGMRVQSTCNPFCSGINRSDIFIYVKNKLPSQMKDEDNGEMRIRYDVVRFNIYTV